MGDWLSRPSGGLTEPIATHHLDDETVNEARSAIADGSAAMNLGGEIY